MATVTPRKRKLPDFTESPIVISVGKANEKFTIHPSVITRSSKYFEAKLSGRWGCNNSFTVLPDPEVCRTTFQIYCNWLYGGEIDFSEQLSNAKDPKGAYRYYKLAQLYVLGDMIQDKAFRNAVLDTWQLLEKEIGSRAGNPVISLAFEKTHPSSTLCRWLVDNALHSTSPDWLAERYSQLPAMFLEQLTIGWARATCDPILTYAKPITRERCLYHEHDEEVPQRDDCPEAIDSPAAKLKTPAAKKVKR